MNYYIADLHFGHKNTIEFDERPFENADEMDKAIIDGWNKKVTENDNVYILGDFSYMCAKSPDWYLSQLLGHKHLIMGNYDKFLLEDETSIRYFESVDIMKYVEDELAGEKVHISLCHFPVLEWDKKSIGSFHIYGHIHSHDYEASRIMYEFNQGRALNAGCMINHYEPCSLIELIINNEFYYNTYVRL